MKQYKPEELTQALEAIDSIVHKCEKAQTRFEVGSTHYTLLKNRLAAMYISKELISHALSKQKPLLSEPIHVDALLQNIEQLHTTDLGAQRIKKNLHLVEVDASLWCKEKIKSSHSQISRRGKNWYVLTDNCEITINAHSYTIITAHKQRT